MITALLILNYEANIGKQDTREAEMGAGYNYHIGTPTICQPYLLDINSKETPQHFYDENTTRAPPARTALRVPSVGTITRPISVKVMTCTHWDNGLHREHPQGQEQHHEDIQEPDHQGD